MTRKEYHKQWRDRNKDHVSDYSKNYYQKNKKKLQKYQKDYRRKTGIDHFRKIASKYGLDKNDLASMYAEQENKCAICGVQRRTLCVDHEHGTKPVKVRQLLCHRCNSVLGHIENEELMKSTIEYLERHDALSFRLWFS